MREWEGLASAGAFCPNEECQLYANLPTLDRDTTPKIGEESK